MESPRNSIRLSPLSLRTRAPLGALGEEDGEEDGEEEGDGEVEVVEKMASPSPSAVNDITTS
jgi:hypothetical protein